MIHAVLNSWYESCHFIIKYNNESELQNSEHLNSESFFDDDLTKLNVRQIQTDHEKFVSTEEVPSHLEMTVDTGIEIEIIRKTDQ